LVNPKYTGFKKVCGAAKLSCSNSYSDVDVYGRGQKIVFASKLTSDMGEGAGFAIFYERISYLLTKIMQKARVAAPFNSHTRIIFI